MSRKTRKLIWSAPLVAVLAVAGVLAMFVALEPGSVFANPLPNAPSNLVVEPAMGDAGRTTLVLTWDAPAGGNVTGYRIDKSDDRFVWDTLQANAGPSRTYRDSTLTSDSNRWYRVFAVNPHGVGPVAVPNSGTTDEKVAPGKVRNLMAVADGRNQINLSWDPPADNGGKKITAYVIQYHDGSMWAPLQGEGLTATGFLTGKTSYQDKNQDKLPPGDDTFNLDPGEKRNYRVLATNIVLGDDTAFSDLIVTAVIADIADAEVDTADKLDWAVKKDAMTQVAGDPGRVTGLTAVNTGTTDGGVSLYWFAPTDTGGWPISHYVIQARRDLAGKKWKDLPDADATLETGDYDSGNPGAEDSYNFRILVPGVGSAQKVFESVPHDYDADPDTDDMDMKPLRWEFQVFVETVDDGVDDGDDAADNKVRRSAQPSETAKVVADGRPNTGDLHAPPMVMTTMRGQTSDRAPKEEQINLAITAAVRNLYRIDVSEDSGLTWKPLERNTIFTDVGSNNRVYEHVRLPYDATRDYRVFTIKNNWRTSVGPATDMTPGSTAMSEEPGKPTGVMASAPNLKTIQASWSEPADNGGQSIIRYGYQYVQDDGDGIADAGDWEHVDNPNQAGPITVHMTDGPELMDTLELSDEDQLDGAETYYIRAHAVNRNPIADGGAADRVGLWSDGVEFDTGEAAAPGMVEGLTAEAASDNSAGDAGVNLLWNEPSSGTDVDNYAVQRKVGNGEWESPTTDADKIIDVTAFTDPDELEADEMRMYRVRGENTVGEGLWTMVDYPRDPAADHSHVRINPSNLMVTVTGTTVRFTWTDGSGTTGHTVGLVNLSDYSVPHEDTVANGVQMHEYTNVAPGRYMVAVLGTPWMSKYYDIEFIEVMSGN